MPALTLSPTPVTEPVIKVAHALVAHLQAGEPIDHRLVRQLLEVGLLASGTRDRRSIRHAYDALELAQILFSPRPRGAACRIAEALAAPSRPSSTGCRPRASAPRSSSPSSNSRRLLRSPGSSGGPPRLSSADTLLEPSAGTGMLAWPAARAGARLILNEIDPVRRLCLREAFRDAQVTGHDGELIDDLLPPDHRPTVVIMNPPFARSEGRGEDRHAADRHLARCRKTPPRRRTDRGADADLVQPRSCLARPGLAGST